MNNLFAKKATIFKTLPLLGNNIIMRLVETSDAEFILEMRLDSKKNRYISKVENDLEKQILWLKEYKKRESKCEEFYFIIESKSAENSDNSKVSKSENIESKNANLIQKGEIFNTNADSKKIMNFETREKLGLVRIYDFKLDSFCWGSWIIKDSAPKLAAIESAMQVYIFAFEILGFKNSHFDVRNDNISVINFHKRLFNATITHTDSLNTYFTFSYNDFLESKKKYARFLPKVTQEDSKCIESTHSNNASNTNGGGGKYPK
ncbi:hypothetical protein [Helicobacter saguini]|uniref:hypothetical protein n=1 Tax=Helicobacter saguini TaxID=1548018 RepID=UPI001927E8E5|nr:hypothetical protein [Helicobacter saguini]